MIEACDRAKELPHECLGSQIAAVAVGATGLGLTLGATLLTAKALAFSCRDELAKHEEPLFPLTGILWVGYCFGAAIFPGF